MVIPHNHLVLYARDQSTASEIIAEFQYNGTNTIIVSCVYVMRPVFNQMLANGITNIVGGSTKPIKLFTPSTDPHFINKLAEYCKENYEFVVQVSGGGGE